MECFEIVKYPSYNYDENGTYTKNEWTSISDIGRCFEGKKFTLLEYLSTEQKYINVVERILEITKCRYVCISYMELDEEDSLRKILRRNLDVEKLKKTIQMLENKKRIHVSHIADVVRLALREYVFIILNNQTHGFKIEFGYDYYMYIYTNLDASIVKRIVQEQNLFLNPRYI